jgi:hypothetical protein
MKSETGGLNGEDCGEADARKMIMFSTEAVKKDKCLICEKNE